MKPGGTLVVQEYWRGHLWSAVPHVLVVAEADQYVTYLPAGAAATYASSVGIPGRDHLSRAERKLLAMESCVYRVVERQVAPETLHFFTRGSWARVNLGWTTERTFLGWYVNFELPATPSGTGLRTMDLVLDILIGPDGEWAWKDRADFDEAVRRGVLDPKLLATFEAESDRVRARAASRLGPFDERWQTWRPDPGWCMPVLPPEYQVGGRCWGGG
ncbi:DUF402 domain-containing protein [Actinopolymorpha pittospori]